MQREPRRNETGGFDPLGQLVVNEILTNTRMNFESKFTTTPHDFGRLRVRYYPQSLYTHNNRTQSKCGGSGEISCGMHYGRLRSASGDDDLTIMIFLECL